MEFIDLKKQYAEYKNSIDQAIAKVLNNSSYIMGPEVFELEKQLAQYVGVKHCISASSGTDTLLMALMAIGIKPGDEVITTPFTWISSSEVISLLGAKPVFVDINPHTFNIDTDLLEAAITTKAKAILPVCLFGQVPKMEEINEIASRYDLRVIEDAAQSFGATRHGKESCSLSDIGSTSFFPAKPFGCYGDGGALFTNDDNYAHKLRAIRTHGGVERHKHEYIGINARLDTIQAAVLLAKLPHYKKELEMRQAVGMNYDELLRNYFEVPKIEKGNTSSYAMYTIKSKKRDEIAAKLKAKGIPTGVYYPVPLYKQACFKYLEVNPVHFPETEKACNEVLSIPMHPWLTMEEQKTVANAMIEAIR
ncbi:MAG: DegT/DnrJ/EryC1/StrS family aminotransferase [Bacteriovoracaceae bacterium]